MVTFAELRDANPGAVRGAAEAFEDVAARYSRLHESATNDLEAPIRKGGWSGDAATAGLHQMAMLREEYDVNRMKARGAAQLLHAIADSIVERQRGLQIAGVGAQHVWVGIVPDDPVGSSRTALPYGLGKPLAPLVEQAHGRQPQSAQCGANLLHTDTSGHSGYWTDNSQSLKNQAAIIAGNHRYLGVDRWAPS